MQIKDLEKEIKRLKSKVRVLQVLLRRHVPAFKTITDAIKTKSIERFHGKNDSGDKLV